MPSDARERAAQQLGQILEAHNNGSAATQEEAAPEAVEQEIPTEESEAEPQEHEGGEESDQESESLRSDLQPKAGDSEEVAETKRHLLKRLGRAEQRLAKARKGAQGDPDAAKKAAA